jgi:hypothetical protein
MAILLRVLVVAFFIWLAVHISNLRTKPGIRFWIAAALAALLSMYPLSFGPACRLAEHGNISLERVGEIYSPIIRLGRHGPEPIRGLIRRSVDLASGCSEKTGILARLEWEPDLQAIDREQRRIWQARHQIAVNFPVLNPDTTPESE